MLPGGCGRNKAGRPGGRYRRALHLGYGDDAVCVTNAVTELSDKATVAKRSMSFLSNFEQSST